jgi:aldose 1-epimerase
VGARILHSSVAGFAARTLVSPDDRLDATFVPELNMLGTSLVHDGEELLHLRGGVEAYAVRAKTCGIPFLHPWANRLEADEYEIGGVRVDLSEDGRPVPRDANGLPSHGLLGGRTPWEITSEHATAALARISARFRFDAPDLLARFPFAHELGMLVEAGSGELTIRTTCTAVSDAPVPISFGFHPYLQLPGVARERWVVELPVRRRLVLDARSIPTGAEEDAVIERAPLGGRTWDDGFTGIDGMFAIEGGDRRIEIEFDDGYPYVQVWAPPGADFICIEPMTAPANALRSGKGLRFADAGRPFAATFRIRVRR